MHAYVVAEKPTTRMVVPTSNQKSMYLNTYLILAGTLKKQLSVLIKNSFRIIEDVKVISTESSKDLFNQIRFDFEFEKAKNIEIVLFAVSELEKNLGELWRCFYTNKPLDETFNKSLITKVRRYLQNPNVRKDIPDVPGFIVVLKLDPNNKVLGVKLAPAKHGPAEGQLGGILKLTI